MKILYRFILLISFLLLSVSSMGVEPEIKITKKNKPLIAKEVLLYLKSVINRNLYLDENKYSKNEIIRVFGGGEVEIKEINLLNKAEGVAESGQYEELVGLPTAGENYRSFYNEISYDSLSLNEKLPCFEQGGIWQENQEERKVVYMYFVTTVKFMSSDYQQRKMGINLVESIFGHNYLVEEREPKLVPFRHSRARRVSFPPKNHPLGNSIVRYEIYKNGYKSKVNFETNENADIENIIIEIRNNR